MISISFTIAGGYLGGFIFHLFTAGTTFTRAIWYLFPSMAPSLEILSAAAGMNVSITRTSLATSVYSEFVGSGSQCNLSNPVGVSHLSGCYILHGKSTCFSHSYILRESNDKRRCLTSFPSFLMISQELRSVRREDVLSSEYGWTVNVTHQVLPSGSGQVAVNCVWFGLWPFLHKNTQKLKNIDQRDINIAHGWYRYLPASAGW